MAQAVAQRLSLPLERLGERLPGIAAWGLGFVPIAVLAFQGGGYDAVVRSQVGIAVWWILALGCLVGAITPAFPSRPALIAAALLAALGVWSWIGIVSSESPERTLSEVARIATYLGVLLLGLFTLDRRRAPAALLGVASAIVLVAGLAVLSRLQPGLFPANETGAYLDIARHRLNWPLNYWNGLAAFVAIGVPVLLAIAAGHRHVAVRAASAAALPSLALCLDFTISRGGIAASVLGVIVLLAIAPIRARIMTSVAVAGTASVILILAAAQRGLLHEDLRTGAALQQGDELTVVLIVVSLGAGLIQGGMAILESLRFPASLGERRARLRPTRRQWATYAGSILVAIVIAGLLVGVPGRVVDAFNDFKSPAAQVQLTGNNDPSRLGSFSSNGRYQLWRAAVRSMGAHPVLGTGAGTYEFTWLRDTTFGRTVRDAHSLYLELGSETGLLGLILGLAFVGALLIAACRLSGLNAQERSIAAAGVAGLCAFAFTAGVDWAWELPAVALAALLLAAIAAAAGRAPLKPTKPSTTRRAVVAAAAVLSGAVLVVVLAGATSVNESRASARAGSLAPALDHAAAAHAIDPAAATPLLQSALVREEDGDVLGAAADARAARDREPLNWRTWIVLSRLEARLGHPGRSVAAFRRARALNPFHPMFSDR